MNSQSSVACRTALFFGSFNPIHNGHIGIARYLLAHNFCDELWFVISPCNPFKQDQKLLPEQKRLELVQQAIVGEWNIKACDVEFALPRPSYTANTLRVLKDRFPARSFALVMGADNLKNFHHWKEYEWIQAHVPLLVYPRSGEIVLPASHPGVTFVEAPLFPFSSTEIRERVACGEDISGIVPSEILSLVLQLYISPFV